MMYDWDDIELDSSFAHNSRKFFAQRRSKHEKIDIKTENVEEIGVLQQIEDDFEQQNGEKAVSKEVKQIKREDEEEFVQQIDELSLTDDCAEKIMSLKNEENNKIKTTCTVENKENETTSQKSNAVSMPKGLLNLATPSRFRKPTNGAIPKKVQPKSGPFQRLIAVSNKRELLLKQQIEEEKKMREFHSRPMPTFKEPVKPKVYKATAPKTPVVVKRSKESRLKMLEKLKEIEEKSKPAPFKAHPADVVNEAPFVPKKVSTVVVTKPYNLRSERRLAERKKYDEAVHRALDAKKNQQEEELKKLDEERCKELRKATVFKARPNPFK